MKTVVLQSFRTNHVPPWMQRCMASVRAWAELQGYDYEFMDDRIFDLCGADYLSQVGDNKCSITNLARLELMRLRLTEAYERAIWLDADTFVFAPCAFRMDITEGYAFAREVWVVRDKTGRAYVRHSVHNASCVFTRGQADLDFLIRTVRYIASSRKLRDNYQVGVRLLSGLQYSLGFPVLQDSGIFSPDIVYALAKGDDGLLAALARGHHHPVHAANLCWSLIGAKETGRADAPEDIITAAMDRLERTAGAVINRFSPAPELPARTAPIATSTTIWSHREKASYLLNSPAWLFARALRVLAVSAMPERLSNGLRHAFGSVDGE